MLRRFLLTSVCTGAAAVVFTAVGCAAQNAASPETSGPSSRPGQISASVVSQGRYPAPIYPQEAQAPYALTGQQAQPAWTPSGHVFQVGNAQIVIPPAP